MSTFFIHSFMYISCVLPCFSNRMWLWLLLLFTCTKSWLLSSQSSFTSSLLFIFVSILWQLKTMKLRVVHLKLVLKMMLYDVIWRGKWSWLHSGQLGSTILQFSISQTPQRDKRNQTDKETLKRMIEVTGVKWFLEKTQTVKTKLLLPWQRVRSNEKWNMILKYWQKKFWSNISKTRRRVSSDIQTPRSRLKNEAQPSFFNDFEVFRYLMKHTFECLIWLLKWSIILGEIQGYSWQNVMVIRNTYPNHGHSSDFLCFLLIFSNLLIIQKSKIKEIMHRDVFGYLTKKTPRFCNLNFPFKISLFEKLCQTLVTVFHYNIKNLKVRQKFPTLFSVFDMWWNTV